MEANYKYLNEYITAIDKRNVDSRVSNLLGVSISKTFINSVANIVGTDLSKYKIIEKGQFACNLMHVGRDGGIALSLYKEDSPAIVSPSYVVFKVSNNAVLPEYLELIFMNPELDREAVFNAIVGVRGTLSWGDFCKLRISIPSLSEQEKIVSNYNKIQKRIELLHKLNSKFEMFAERYFKSYLSKCESKREYKLTEIAKFINGYSYSSQELIDSSYGLVTIKNINKMGGFRVNEFKSIVPENKYENKKLELFDVIIACTDLTPGGEIIGNTTLVLSKGKYEQLILSTDLVKVVPIVPEISNYIMVEIMKYVFTKDKAISYSNGTNVLHFDKNAFKIESIYLPNNLSKFKDIDQMIGKCYQLILKHIDEEYILLSLQNRIISHLL